jgi:hypothetical protein
MTQQRPLAAPAPRGVKQRYDQRPEKEGRQWIAREDPATQPLATHGGQIAMQPASSPSATSRCLYACAATTMQRIEKV